MLLASFKIIEPLVLKKEMGFKCVFFIIYGHDSHLGHVTWHTYSEFRSPFQRKAHIKVYFSQAFWEKKYFERG